MQVDEPRSGPRKSRPHSDKSSPVKRRKCPPLPSLDAESTRQRQSDAALRESLTTLQHLLEEAQEGTEALKQEVEQLRRRLSLAESHIEMVESAVRTVHGESPGRVFGARLGRPPPYAGPTGKVKLREWLPRVRHYCEAGGDTGAAAVCIAVSFLEGPAFAWWLVLAESLAAEGKSVQDLVWTEFETLIKDRFGDKNVDNRAELHALRMRGTTRAALDAYVSAFESLCAQVKQHEADKLFRFVHGLHSTVSSTVAVDPTTGCCFTTYARCRDHLVNAMAHQSTHQGMVIEPLKGGESDKSGWDRSRSQSGGRAAGASGSGSGSGAGSPGSGGAKSALPAGKGVWPAQRPPFVRNLQEGRGFEYRTGRGVDGRRSLAGAKAAGTGGVRPEDRKCLHCLQRGHPVLECPAAARAPSPPPR